MHEIEPYYNWRNYYQAEEDERSPFYSREYSEFEFTNSLYNYLIHPQWDTFGSPTLFTKILFANYEEGYCIMELMGEWNDAINNDIMWLKREVVDSLLLEGIHKFILIGENVLNFHYSDDSYYEEWFEDVNEKNGWITMINFTDYVVKELETANVDNYILIGGKLNEIEWRAKKPEALYDRIRKIAETRLLL